MKEAEILRYCLRYLKAKGYYFGRVNTGGIKRGNVWCRNPYTLKGIPDIVGAVNIDNYGGIISTKHMPLGRGITQMFGIECKSSVGKQSGEQIEFQRWFEASGGLYVIVRTQEDIKKVL